jgi:hypothetical protein
LHAQFDQVVQEVVVVVAKLQALEEQWGFRARAPPPAAP